MSETLTIPVEEVLTGDEWWQMDSGPTWTALSDAIVSTGAGPGSEAEEVTVKVRYADGGRGHRIYEPQSEITIRRG